MSDVEEAQTTEKTRKINVAVKGKVEFYMAHASRRPVIN
jgi:hypothetical protein